MCIRDSTTIMYSTNTNNQQDRGRQAPNVKPAPKGGQTMKDMFTATPAEREIIERIAKRAVALYRKYGNTDVDEMDIQDGPGSMSLQRVPTAAC